MVTPKKYDESDFQVLKGLEPVRQRPGMYTRTDNPLHIIQEVIDNAADEALAGFAKSIAVTLTADGGVVVADNGRGIPVGAHATEKEPVVTLAFTRLHAGGKFNKTAGGAYAFAGGLHGVGVAVTTALSTKVEVEIRRDGKIYAVSYLDGGRQIGAVKAIGECPKQETGTIVRAWPDGSYFESPKIPRHELERVLRSKAVLLPGLTVTLNADGNTQTWHYEHGLAEYLTTLAGDAQLAAPLYVGEKYHQAAPESNSTETDAFAPGEGASFAFAWFSEGGLASESYVNLIPTPSGGTHESGLKNGVFEAVRSFIDHHALLPRGVKLQQEDVCGHMGYVLSAKVLDPQFQGQTKERLNSRSAYKLVATMVRDPFELWLNAHVDAGKAIAEIAIRQALARQKNGQKVEKRKSSGITMLPGKLADCEATTDNELFLVEGDSAGGSAKQARNRENQAILPLRGKVLNTWEVGPDRLFANREIHDMAVAIGVDPHTLETTPEIALANLRYTRIVIMTDADVDGAHIQALLSTYFYKHLPWLIVRGYVYIAQAPLFRIDVASGGKGKPARRIYALDDAERDSTLQKLARENVPESRIEIGRFKGLGEMNADQLKETAMDPATRRVLPMTYDPAEAQAVNAMFHMLMSESQAAGRRDWMARKGSLIEADV